MLQSSNQYLLSDYLTAPNALDSKSSPLALLAQTCSAIGADTTNPKLLAANIEKSTKSLKYATDSRDKVSPVSSHSSSVSTGSIEHHQQIKSSFKPYESNNNHFRDRLEAEAEFTVNATGSSQRVKTPKSGAQPQKHNGQQQRCDSNQSATSQRDSPGMSTGITNELRRTPTGSVAAIDLQHRSISSPQRVSSKESATNISPQAQVSPSSQAQTISHFQAASEAAFAAAKDANYAKAIHAAANAASISTSSASGTSGATYYHGYPGSTNSMPYPMELMAASTLISPHHPMFKAAAMNPYLNYARLKGIDASIASAMITPNVCRDPYCTGCPSSPHFLNKAAGQPCSAGCLQCEGSANKSISSGSGNYSAAMAAAAAAASSYHVQLAALTAASQMPYVCSWFGGDVAYCGKRFSTSDELFQHLRTHTGSMPDSVLSAAAAGGIPPNHPLFQRTYPTPPLSPLSATRYHPYGKPSMMPPSLGPMAMPPHPALAQYFSPYSLYGPRMGSSHP